MVATGDRIDIVYTLEGGRGDGTLELHVEDLRPAEPTAPHA
jgi:hypothetical protein